MAIIKDIGTRTGGDSGGVAGTVPVRRVGRMGR
jgi:hypothetical protein